MSTAFRQQPRPKGFEISPDQVQAYMRRGTRLRAEFLASLFRRRPETSEGAKAETARSSEALPAAS